MSSFGLWRPPGADFGGGAPTPGSLALRASVTGGYDCAALRAKWMPRTFHKFNVNQHSRFSSLYFFLLFAKIHLLRVGND